MKTIILLILFAIFPFKLQQQDKQQDKLTRWDGKPTSLGIDLYVEHNQDYFLSTFKKYVKDSLYSDIWFTTRNFKKTTPKEQYDPFVLAYNESYGNGSCEIVIDNQERYQGFDYKEIKNPDSYNQFDYFVKQVVLHEIMHDYFNQCILELKMNDTIGNIVNTYYTTNLYTFPNIELQFGAKFIEEGICEYFIQANKECPQLVEYYVPQTVNDLKNKFNRNDILYDYRSMYLKDFMDYQIMKFGKIKYPIMILLKNKPPTYQEILNPQLFYNRLII